MKRKKITSALLIITVLVSFLTGCVRSEVPDIMEKKEAEAVKMVKEAQLIPIVEYEYREYDEEGKVFKTRPKITASVKKNTEVVIYVSKGPENIVAKNAYCKWTSIGKSKEKWGFTLPYVNKGVLYIDCNDVVLSESIKWKKSSEEGVGIAEVSLTEDFEQTTLAKIKYDKEESSPFEPMHIILAVPIEELKEEKPSALYFKLATEKNGESEDIRVDFTITW